MRFVEKYNLNVNVSGDWIKLQKIMCYNFLKNPSMPSIYIIINVLSERSRIPLHGIGRAIARWNRLGSHMNTPWEVFASRAPYARSTQNCVFYYIRQF